MGQRVRAEAMRLTQRLPRLSLPGWELRSSAPTTLESPKGGFLIGFRYGVVVLVGVNRDERLGILDRVRDQLDHPSPDPEVEGIDLEIAENESESVSHECVILPSSDLGSIQIVAEVLAKSVLLEHYEQAIDHYFEGIEPAFQGLAKAVTGGRSRKDLLNTVQASLSAEYAMMARAEVTDKPELLWDRPELERLNLRLESEFEIGDRHRILTRKLDLLRRAATTLLDLRQERSTLRVEWLIVLLIFIEIVLFLYELFVAG